MNDSEVRKIVLKLFYEKRKENFISINEKNFGDQFPISEIYRICSQLKDLGYIDFKAQYADNQIYSAWGKISVFGTDYVEQMHSKTQEGDFVFNTSTNSPKPPIAQINIAGDVTHSTILVGNENTLHSIGQEKSRRGTNPILRIRDYGNEVKNLYGINDFVVGYDTLYIDIFNKQNLRNAEKVWAKIEWINKNSVVEVSHRGRWHIATETMKNETVKENLQYCNIDSNQAPQRLYFAWTPKNNTESYFYGLERDMNGHDSWGHLKYKLDAEEYTAKITLQGNNGVKQQFKYRVRNSNGKISIIEALTNESRKQS